MTDAAAIEAAIGVVIAANSGKVREVAAKPNLVGWFVGQVMKETGGKANPKTVMDRLKQTLGLP